MCERKSRMIEQPKETPATREKFYFIVTLLGYPLIVITSVLIVVAGPYEVSDVLGPAFILTGGLTFLPQALMQYKWCFIWWAAGLLCLKAIDIL